MDYIQKTMVENWRREMEAAQLYELSAGRESDERRRDIFRQLADIEYKHARMWEAKLKESGFNIQQLKRPRVSIDGLSSVGIVQRIEAIEDSNAAWYQSLRNVIEDAEIVRIIDEIDADEAAHGKLDQMLQAEAPPEKRLRTLWSRERHRQGSSDWVGDAIYGVNDGLGLSLASFPGSQVLRITRTQCLSAVSLAHWLVRSPWGLAHGWQPSQRMKSWKQRWRKSDGKLKKIRSMR